LDTFDLTYLTIDSISEGVGSSQILPVITLLAESGLKINLMSFENKPTPPEIENRLKNSGVVWTRNESKLSGPLDYLNKVLILSRNVQQSRVLHARSDLPAMAAHLSNEAPFLWDVRSLWADQKAFMETSSLKRSLFKQLTILEKMSFASSAAISTLTSSVVPILEARYGPIQKPQIVVPTVVDLTKFQIAKQEGTGIRGLYSGTYNNFYDLELSYKLVENMKSIANIEVSWARPEESLRKSLNAGEDKVFSVSPNNIHQVIQDFHFGISVCKLNAGPSALAAVPTKIAEFLATGKPVVVSQGLGDLDEQLTEFNAGISLSGKPGDIEYKATMLLELLQDPDTALRCRALAEKYFDVRAGVEKYQWVYTQIQN
jgi:hypothetical protein